MSVSAVGIESSSLLLPRVTVYVTTSPPRMYVGSTTCEAAEAVGLSTVNWAEASPPWPERMAVFHRVVDYIAIATGMRRDEAHAHRVGAGDIAVPEDLFAGQRGSRRLLHPAGIRRFGGNGVRQQRAGSDGLARVAHGGV